MSNNSSGKLLCKLLLGHESELLNKDGSPNEDGHTHRWTVFVRPAGAGHKFKKDDLIKKVVFHLHPDFKDPIRHVSKPSFEVTETGYAGFSIPVTVHFANFRSFNLAYDMNLSMERRGYFQVEQTIDVTGCPSAMHQRVLKYQSERKRDKEKRSSGESGKSSGSSSSGSGRREEGRGSREGSRAGERGEKSREKQLIKEHRNAPSSGGSRPSTPSSNGGSSSRHTPTPTPIDTASLFASALSATFSLAKKDKDKEEKRRSGSSEKEKAGRKEKEQRDREREKERARRKEKEREQRDKEERKKEKERKAATTATTATTVGEEEPRNWIKEEKARREEQRLSNGSSSWNGSFSSSTTSSQQSTGNQKRSPAVVAEQQQAKNGVEQSAPRTGGAAASSWSSATLVPVTPCMSNASSRVDTPDTDRKRKFAPSKDLSASRAVDSSPSSSSSASSPSPRSGDGDACVAKKARREGLKEGKKGGVDRAALKMRIDKAVEHDVDMLFEVARLLMEHPGVVLDLEARCLEYNLEEMSPSLLSRIAHLVSR